MPSKGAVLLDLRQRYTDREHRMRLKSVLILLLGWPLAAGAGAVHKWVDADGVTHYSDEAPDAGATEVSLVEVTVGYTPPADIEDDYYSIANQWKRMQAERLAMAKIKLEREQLKAKSQPEVVYVELDRDRLSQLGLSPSVIVNELQSRNIVSNAGRVNVGDDFIAIHPTGLVGPRREFLVILLSAHVHVHVAPTASGAFRLRYVEGFQLPSKLPTRRSRSSRGAGSSARPAVQYLPGTTTFFFRFFSPGFLFSRSLHQFCL